MILLGKYVLPDGNVKMGIWEDGKRVSWVDEDGNEI
jgi:hypothetical protein